jgi:hypothetical protein
MSANKCGRLEDGLEETNRHDMLRLLSSCSGHCQHSPCNLFNLAKSREMLINYTRHAGWKEVSWFDIVQSNVAGHLSNSISNRKNGVDLIELVSSEAQLFSHARYIGII